MSNKVEQAVIDQIRWERDTAIEQLSEIGKGLGERMDDVEKVVRCKDCKHRDHETNFCHGRGWTMNLVADDDFCSRAERRTDAD